MVQPRRFAAATCQLAIERRAVRFVHHESVGSFAHAGSILPRSIDHSACSTSDVADIVDWRESFVTQKSDRIGSIR
jgi:hypothetical protein